MSFSLDGDRINRNVMNAVLREDLGAFIHRSFQTVSPGPTFLPNWHIDAIAHHLRQCIDGDTKRLIITMPPRSLKSICTSVAFPAFILGLDPTARVIGVSYAEDLSKKHSRDSRKVMQSEWYREVFPRTRINPRKNTETEFETTRNGFRLATSVNGTLTGRGGDFIIVDDPLKADDAMSDQRRRSANDWFTNTLLTRLDNKIVGVIVVVMQRLHVDDLVGNLLEAGGWVHLDLPAIAEEDDEIPVGPGRVYRRKVSEVLHPEHEPRDALEQQRADMGSVGFSAQYQQSPVPVAGNMIKRGWFQTYLNPPSKRPSRIVQSWDTASKGGDLNDYSVCTTWHVHGKDYYLVDVFRERLDFPTLKRKVVELKKRHGAEAVLIEDAASGTSLIQELKSGKDVRPIGIKPEKDKVTRMSAGSVKIEAGQVFLPEKAPWLDGFVAEVLAFPQGKHDDQVDSVSQFLGWVERPAGMRMVHVVI